MDVIDIYTRYNAYTNAICNTKKLWVQQYGNIVRTGKPNNWALLPILKPKVTNTFAFVPHATTCRNLSLLVAATLFNASCHPRDCGSAELWNPHAPPHVLIAFIPSLFGGCKKAIRLASPATNVPIQFMLFNHPDIVFIYLIYDADAETVYIGDLHATKPPRIDGQIRRERLTQNKTTPISPILFPVGELVVGREGGGVW